MSAQAREANGPRRRLARFRPLLWALLAAVLPGAPPPVLALGPTAQVDSAPLAEAESLASDAYLHGGRTAVLLRQGVLVVTLPLLELPLGDGSLRFQLTGISGSPGGSWLGPGWGSSLETRLLPSGPDVYAVEPPGTARRFLGQQGRLVAERGNATLRAAAGGYVVEEPAGARRFDAEGWLRALSVGGNEVTVEGPADRPTAQRSADVTLLELRFADNGRLIQARDALGRTARLDYDSAGRLVRVTDFTDLASTFAWDGEGRLARLSAPQGGEVAVEYDARGRVTRLQGPGTAVTALHYGEDGESLSTTLTDPAGRTLAWRFRKDGREVRVTDAGGGVTPKPFDGQGRLVQMTGPGGHTLAFAYDARGRLVSRTAPDGTRESFAYEGPGGALSEVRSPTGRVALARDPQGRLVGVDDGSTRTAYDYDDQGRLRAVRAGDGGAVTLVRDALGRVTEAAGPDGTRERYTYDALGNPLTAVDALGRRTEFFYDRTGRPRGHRDPDGRTHLLQVAPDGRQVRQVDGRGNQVVATLDAQGEPAAVEVNGRRTTYVRDVLGRLAEVGFPDGAWVRYAYDPAGRLREASGRRSGTIRYRYDAAGQLAETETAAAARRRFAYDPAGRLTRVEEAGQPAASVEYDGAARLSRLADGAGRAWTFAWDRAGRLAGRTAPDGGVERLAYDGAGRLTERVAADGATERYTWDASGRLTGLRRGEAWEQRFAYDPAGRLVRNTWPGGALAYAYDPAGNLSRVQEEKGGQAVEYAYDADGLVLSRALSGGPRAEYERDREGNLTRARLGEAEVTVEYDALRRRQRVRYGQAASAEYAYDGEGRVQAVTVRNAAGQPLVSARYGWDTAGRLASTEVDGRRIEYAYDAAGRLAAAKLPDGSRREYAYDRGASLIQAGPARFDLDAAGRPTRLREAGAETAIAWGPAGRLAETRAGAAVTRYVFAGEDLTRVELPGQAGVEYHYDGEGNLVGRSEGRDSVRYLIDGRSLAAEMGPDGRARSIYLDGDRLDEHLARLHEGQPQYYVTDPNLSVLAVLDARGRVLNRYLYGPFGEPLEAREEVPNPFRFQGRLYDPATRLYHYRARWYAPQLARFVSPDPLPGDAANPVTLERYAFLDNDPVNRADPLGTQSGSTFGEFVQGLPAVRNFVRTSIPPAAIPGVDPASSAGRELAQFAARNLAPSGAPSVWQPGTGLDPGQRAVYQNLLSKGFPYRAPPGYALAPRVPTGMSESQAAVKRLQEAGFPNQAGFFQQARNALQDVRQGAQLYGKEVTGTLTLVGGFWGALQQPVGFIAALPGGGLIVGGAVAIAGAGGLLIGTGLNQIGLVRSASTAFISRVMGYDTAGLDAYQQFGPKALAGQQKVIAKNLTRIAQSGLPFDPPDPGVAGGTPDLGVAGSTPDLGAEGPEPEGEDEDEPGDRPPEPALPPIQGSAFAKIAGKTLSGTLTAEGLAPVSTPITLTVSGGNSVEGSFRFPVFFDGDANATGYAEVKVSGSYNPGTGSLSLSFAGASTREQKDVITVPKAIESKSGVKVVKTQETLIFRWTGKVTGSLPGAATSDSSAEGHLDGTYTHVATSSGLGPDAKPSEPYVVPIKGRWTVNAP